MQLNMVTWNSASGGFAYIWQSKWVGTIALKNKSLLPLTTTATATEKRHLKSEVAPPQTLSRLFHLVNSSNVGKRVMLSGEGNENGEKTTIGVISKKATCACNALFLYISLPLYCTSTMWNFQKLPGYTFYGGNRDLGCFLPYRTNRSETTQTKGMRRNQNSDRIDC